MFDVLITGGTIVDGTGAPGFPADLGIKGETIEAIGDLGRAEARRVVDATGHVVCPGFIDTHAHSDGVLLWDPQHANGLRQGITTEILGQDGLSYAPLSKENYPHLPPLHLGHPGRATGRPGHEHRLGLPVPLRPEGIYQHRLLRCPRRRTSRGAGIPRRAADRGRPGEGEAADRRGHRAGAVAFATGLMYFPHSWSDGNEMVELCKAAHEAGGVYVTHLRSNHKERSFGGEGGVPEALEIGRRSGIGVHFSHYRTAPGTHGQVAQRMELIDKAKAEGVDCTMELYPYPSGCTFALSMLPSHIHDGGPEAALNRIKDPSERKKLAEGLESRGGLREAVVTYSPETPEAEGMSVVDLSEARGISPGEMVCQLLVENDLKVAYRGAPPDSVAVWRQVSRDTMDFLSRPDYMVGSDAIPIGSMPHPRAYGTFPRILGRLHRQFDVMSLEQLVQRMTDNAARRFGLTKRGRLETGYFADVVVFDRDRIIDNATYDDPTQHPSGIPYVLVNGQVAVDSERCTGVLAGRAVP